MKKEEIIRNLENLRESIAWEKPLYYLVAIDEAIKIIKEVMEREQQGEDNKNSGI